MKFMFRLSIRSFVIYFIEISTPKYGPCTPQCIYINLLMVGIEGHRKYGILSFAPRQYLHVLGWTFKRG